jgi:hypothetical protein
VRAKKKPAVDFVRHQAGKRRREKNLCHDLGRWKHHSERFFAVSITKVAVCGLEVLPCFAKFGIVKRFKRGCE